MERREFMRTMGGGIALTALMGDTLMAGLEDVASRPNIFMIFTGETPVNKIDFTEMGCAFHYQGHYKHLFHH